MSARAKWFRWRCRQVQIITRACQESDIHMSPPSCAWCGGRGCDGPLILLFAAIRVVVVRMRMVMRVRMDVVYIEVHMFDVAIYRGGR